MTVVLVSATASPAAKSTTSNLTSPPPGCAPQGQKPRRRAGFATQIVARLAESLDRPRTQSAPAHAVLVLVAQGLQGGIHG